MLPTISRFRASGKTREMREVVSSIRCELILLNINFMTCPELIIIAKVTIWNNRLGFIYYGDYYYYYYFCAILSHMSFVLNRIKCVVLKDNAMNYLNNLNYYSC